MKKLLFVTENEKQTILEMHGFINNPNVINEQYVELEKIFINPLIKGLEKTDSKAFNELSTILGRGTDETLSGAFDRVLSKAVDQNSREAGINILKFCKKLSSINPQFAEEFYNNQIKVIDKIRQNPKYSNQWEKLIKDNYGEEVLEKYKKNNIKPNAPKPDEKPVEQKPTPPKPAEQVKPQTGISIGNYKVLPINDGSKFAKFMDAFFSKVFYEGNEKRMDAFSMDIIKQFTPETKSYLLQLLDIVKRKNLSGGLEQGFKSDYGRLPKTVDEEIQMLSSNFWAGYGRTGGLQGILNEAPVPSANVMDNLMNVTMTPSQKEKLMDYGHKIEVFKK
jgi:hypothetical protein